MITNTNCQKCIFANKANQDEPCQHNIIEYIKDHKKLDIVNDYYVINEYVCRMGFSKDIYEANKDKISLEDIKQEIVDRACMRYYLILDISTTSPEALKNTCDILLDLKIKPAFISFIMLPSDDNKEKITVLKTLTDDKLMWKAHSFIETMDIDNVIHSILDTNFQNNHSEYILIYDINNLEQLDNDINEINSNIIIYQKPFHYARKHNSSNLDGLFMHFNNYQVCRSRDNHIVEALKAIPEAIVLEYGNSTN